MLLNLARDGDAGKAALLDLACDVEGRAPMTRLRDEIEGGQWFGHHLPSQASDEKFKPVPSDVITIAPVGSNTAGSSPCDPANRLSSRRPLRVGLQQNHPRAPQLFGGLARSEGSGVDCATRPGPLVPALDERRCIDDQWDWKPKFRQGRRRLLSRPGGYARRHIGGCARTGSSSDQSPSSSTWPCG